MAGRTCQRPGCSGRYEGADGGELYCGACGLAPVVSAVGVIGATATGLTPPARQDPAPASSGSGQASGRDSSRSQASRRSVSGRLSRSVSGSGVRSVSVRSSGTTAGTSARNRLGAGLVTVPEVPKADPASVVLDDPRVPERKRFCSNGACGAKVGRSRGGRPGRTEGFCTQCGRPYSYLPKLRAGDVVHGQYEIAGCLAHGGLGWIYLAVDHAVSNRWVVLKGLLDTGDEDAMAVAISERRFLAEIEHANIVRIYNFVEHLDRRTGSLDGYIVMEYVGGRSLKDIANSRRTEAGRRDPLPVEQACAYGIEALEALGHLHSRNLLYCDFKVDNAIQQADQLKLIDMGAVRRMDDLESPIYGTVGYQAPEVPETGPSVASDLYTVARTLAVLTFDFKGYTGDYADRLPDPESVEIFRRYESFYRFLVRATDPDPQRRFASAQEMADQLTGVLREIVALRTERPRPALSTLFGPELRVVDTALLPHLTGDASALGARAAVPAGGGRFGRLLRRRAAAGAGGAGSAHAPGPTQGWAGPAAPHPAAGPGASGGGRPSPPPAGYTAAHPAEGTSTGPDGDGDLDTAGTLSLVAQSRRAATAPEHPRGGPPSHGVPGPPPGLPPGYAPGAGAGAGAGRGAAAWRAGGPASAAHGPALVPLETRATALALPVPRVDLSDPCAGFLAGLAGSAPAEVAAALAHAPADSIERRLRELRALLELAGPQDRHGAARLLAELEARHPEDWRVVWFRGLTALADGDRETAALSFDALYDAFPGEIAPKLALGVCAETLGQLDNAAEYYRLVWTTDPSYVSAAFGLARVRLATGDRQGSVQALESVPETSSHHTAARVAAVRARLRGRDPRTLPFDDLCAAARQVEQLREAGLDALRYERLTTEVLGVALDWVLATRPAFNGHVLPLLNAMPEEARVREALERSYRRLARLAQSGSERIELVERANRFRPRTWV
ncbi:tetratricopeptide repeat protein [Streptomyces sp. DSM 42041]|uniref:non-specific serine/threonine protein kinase n=1 Tax=Streptomyces hazeniae TaxID=3075538 RepID=A0ABU2NKZ0_9ACTN|nr:tetratricopeptide repeat protein [Streptomyces sp. DSM 42041]MDT0377637.1 tetratricopeptide repeat protein [Streptomyces sp. DSM 42041]